MRFIPTAGNIAAPGRKRVLDHAEIRAMWAAADALDWPFGPFYKLLLLTGGDSRLVSAGTDGQACAALRRSAGRLSGRLCRCCRTIRRPRLPPRKLSGFVARGVRRIEREIGEKFLARRIARGDLGELNRL